jgi:hypothetical protein
MGRAQSKDERRAAKYLAGSVRVETNSARHTLGLTLGRLRSAGQALHAGGGAGHIHRLTGGARRAYALTGGGGETAHITLGADRLTSLGLEQAYVTRHTDGGAGLRLVAAGGAQIARALACALLALAGAAVLARGLTRCHWTHAKMRNTKQHPSSQHMIAKKKERVSISLPWNLPAEHEKHAVLAFWNETEPALHT